SSRRRHTRSYGDWSSDVCSSDLDISVGESTVKRTGPSTITLAPLAKVTSAHPAAKSRLRPAASPSRGAGRALPVDADAHRAPARSEERRVGKERNARSQRHRDHG